MKQNLFFLSNSFYSHSASSYLDGKFFFSLFLYLQKNNTVLGNNILFLYSKNCGKKNHGKLNCSYE